MFNYNTCKCTFDVFLCRLEFTEALDILAMFSSEGEKVVFSESISTSAARGAVEKWLLQVQDVMTLSVRDVIEQARDVSVKRKHNH